MMYILFNGYYARTEFVFQFQDNLIYSVKNRGKYC